MKILESKTFYSSSVFFLSDRKSDSSEIEGVKQKIV